MPSARTATPDPWRVTAVTTGARTRATETGLYLAAAPRRMTLAAGFVCAPRGKAELRGAMATRPMTARAGVR